MFYTLLGIYLSYKPLRQYSRDADTLINDTKSLSIYLFASFHRRKRGPYLRNFSGLFSRCGIYDIFINTSCFVFCLTQYIQLHSLILRFVICFINIFYVYFFPGIVLRMRHLDRLLLLLLPLLLLQFLLREM